jgi:hypothetical protein
LQKRCLFCLEEVETVYCKTFMCVAEGVFLYRAMGAYYVREYMSPQRTHALLNCYEQSKVYKHVYTFRFPYDDD